jgi:hypothetical protein
MKVGFFEEKEGVKSMMRLLSYQLEWFFFLINIIYFWLNALSEKGITIDKYFIVFDLILLIGIFVPKYLQKIAESKIVDKI